MKAVKRKRNISLIVFIFFIVFLVAVYYFKVILPIIKVYSSAETESVTEKAVNLAVSNVINRTINYNSLIDINYDNSGNIVSFSANQYEINTITREIIKETQQQLNTLGSDGVNLNIGTFSGIPFLIGKGPLVSLKLVPIGAVNGVFDSEFDSVGINITKHSLFLYVNIHVNIVMPIKNLEVYSTTQVLLAESVIIGKVPDVYLNGGDINKSLNLVP